MRLKGFNLELRAPAIFETLLTIWMSLICLKILFYLVSMCEHVLYLGNESGIKALMKALNKRKSKSSSTESILDALRICL